MTERWLPVVGYEQFYEVSNYGKVRSKTRIDALGRVREGRVLTPTGLRHVHVTLSLHGVKKQKTVHRIVLEAFVGAAPDGTEGCHWDGNPRNNKLDNLRWDSRANNIQDAIRHGTSTKKSGSTLTPAAVRDIRASKALGVSNREIAEQHGTTREAVYAVVSGRTWKHVA